MTVGSLKRERYHDYAGYLRASADQLDIMVAPGRLVRLRSQVDEERATFLAWEVVWLLIGLASLIPVLMLVAVEFGMPMPAPIAARAEALYFLLVPLQNGMAELVAIASLSMFLVSAMVAFAPIIAYGSAVNDLEYAHRALKALEKG